MNQWRHSSQLTMKAQATAAGLAPYTNFISLREERERAVSQLVDSRFDWAHAFHEIGRVLPGTASIGSIAGTIGSATASGASGSSVSAFTVPPRGEAEFELQMTTNLATTLWKILPRLKDASQPVEYRLAGKVRTDLAFVPTISFDERGNLPVR